MQSRLGGGIDSGHRQRHETQHRRHVDYRRVGLHFEVFNYSGGHTDRTEQIRRDRRNQECFVHGTRGIVGHHDASFFEEYVQLRKFRDQRFRYSRDIRWIRDIQLHRTHSRVVVDRCCEMPFAPAGDDDLIVESL